MAKQSASAKLTGGQGFNFEDCVAASFLLGLLGATHPLGQELGHLTKIDWQAADAGWRLEDLAITFGVGDHERSVGMSIKNHKHVSEAGFNESFTQACWEQWLGISTPRQFRPNCDKLALVTGVLAGGVRVAWETMLGAAVELAAAPDRLVARLQPMPGNAGSQSSEMQRDLFQSLHCPNSLRSRPATDAVATAILLRHIRLLHLDFEHTPSQAISDVLIACRALLESGTDKDATALWDVLVRIAARKRGRGGSIDLPELLASLRGRFALRTHPDYHDDWDELTRRSRERYESIGLTVGGVARLSRRAAQRRMRRHLRADRVCVVVGASGSGKSALVRRFGEYRYRLVWLTSDFFQSGRETAFEAQLALRHSLAQVVASSPSRCLVVFDGLDGFGDAGLQLVARLVASLRRAGPNRIRIALTVQSEGIPRLRAAFTAAAVATDCWEILFVRPPGGAAVDRLLTRCPGLTAAALTPAFRSLLNNLKVFDWVVRLQAGGGFTAAEDVSTLTALIDRLWGHFVEDDSDGLARATLLKRIAGVEADSLLNGIPLSALNTSEIALLPSIETAGLLRRHDERLRFAHDMFADWARLKFLIEQHLPDSEPTIRRAATAGWFRAVRLYGQRLLEQPNGVVRWQQCVHSLGVGVPERAIIRDLFIEALIVANDSQRLLQAAWPALVAGDGAFLHLLLDRFGYVATLPDTQALSSIPDPEQAAQLEHLFRVPFEPYWSGMLPVLARHPEDVLQYALAPAAKLLRLCLSKMFPVTRATAPLRQTAAGLTLIIAREVQAREAEGRSSVDKEIRSDVYVALLWSARESSQQVAQLCLELANRRPEADPVRLRRESAREEHRRALERLPETNPTAAEFLRHQLPFDLTRGPKREPWPDGPRYRVDEAFQTACMDGQAILPLAVNLSTEALEVLLAVLIEHPRYENSGYSDFHREHLGLDDNHFCDPPFFYQGPFWTLLRCDPDFAQMFIIRVVNFATERWFEGQGSTIAQYGHNPTQGPTSVQLRAPEEWVEYQGDRDVLYWHNAWRSHPTVLSSMLMALEKWLYDNAGEVEIIEQCATRIFEEGRSTALLGVLVQLGKFKPELLTGPLRPLLSGAELYEMDHRLIAERSRIAFWSTDWMRYGETAWNRARDWYAMPHRKLLLQNLVLPLVLHNDVVREDAMNFYEEWEASLKESPDDRTLEAAVNQFGLVVRYLRASASGGEELPQFHDWLRAQRQEAAAEQRISDDVLPLALAPQCRKRLDENRPLQAGELVPFWDMLQRLANRQVGPREDGTRMVDAVFGGVAVLLVLHRDWVREEPSRDQWCLEQLRNGLSRSPKRGLFADPDSADSWYWDCFAVECGVVLLAEDQANPLARRLVVNGMTCFRYATVAATLRRAYRLRTKLGAEFECMKSFVREWSAWVWALRWSQEWRLDPNQIWQQECLPRIEAYVRGTAVAKRPLAEIDAEGRTRTRSLFAAHVERVERQSESRWQRVLRRSGLLWVIRQCQTLLPAKPIASQPQDLDDANNEDLDTDREYPSLKGGVPPSWPGCEPHYLKAGFAWLEPATSEEHVAEETTEVLFDLLTVIRRTVPTVTQSKRRVRTRFPSKFDHWLFERVAAVLLRVRDPRVADGLWKPILALGIQAEYWVKFFLTDWFQIANRQSPRPDEFVALWGKMLSFTLDEPTWDTSKRRWNDGEELVKELLGFDMGKEMFGADERFANPIGQLAPEFERAASRWFNLPRVAVGFCYFVLKPAGAGLLLPGVRWLAQAQQTWSNWDWENSNLSEALVGALRTALTRHRHVIAGDDLLRGAYVSLCNTLVARGAHAALALRERVATADEGNR